MIAATPVILQTDIGSDIDDTWALLHLLRSPELDLKLIVTDTADTVYRARLTAKFLQVAENDHIPIGIGPRGEPAHEYQAPWLGDYALDDYPGTIYEDGVQAIVDLVRASPEPITIIGIGPIPSIARALEVAPDIAPKCRFVGMFGSVDRGYGRGSEPVAETNVRVNVKAAVSVLSANWRETLITPLDTCDEVFLSGERYQRVYNSDDRAVTALIQNYKLWSELVTWMKVDFFDEKSSTLFDCAAVYLAYATDLVQIERLNLRITDDGMTVRDDEAGFPVDVALGWYDLDAFHAHLTERLLNVSAE